LKKVYSDVKEENYKTRNSLTEGQREIKEGGVVLVTRYRAIMNMIEGMFKGNMCLFHRKGG
jgi:hypothetical protein